ncbi:MAG TPA: DUF2267 domain-containing protein [candidate division Zixibacteria bacterium]|nr:DUF2267 domain-containing protein [candidate division Zixibacteria bacterium]
MKTGPVGRTQAVPKRSRRRRLDVFDATMAKTQTWLNELMLALGWEGKPQKAYLALRTVLHALRDRLPVDEAVQLGAQLPMLVRGFYYEGWTPRKKPVKERREEDFLEHVKEAFKDDVTVNAREIVRAVFRLLRRHVSAGEVEDVRHMLPKPLQRLWP